MDIKKIDILMSQVRQLSLVTSHPFFPFCRHITLHFCALFLFFFPVSKVIPLQLPIKGVWLYKASDMFPGDHVCEKSDAVKWIDCPWLSFI